MRAPAIVFVILAMLIGSGPGCATSGVRNRRARQAAVTLLGATAVVLVIGAVAGVVRDCDPDRDGCLLDSR